MNTTTSIKIQNNTYNTVFHGPMNNAITHLFKHVISRRKVMNREQIINIFHDCNQDEFYYQIEVRCYGNYFTLIMYHVTELGEDELSQHKAPIMLVNLNNDVEFFGRITQETMTLASAIYTEFVKMNVG
ncbi:MAG: hypothetical protein EKK57_02725 [Proteobacteria bacterium]|nr:MAG: hypothetical protein EKK57_02725 [Pseudomonadota bacterium]